MRQNSAKIWLRGCKPRVYKKLRWAVGVDGTYFTPKKYTKFIRAWKRKKVGDPIFDVINNCWDTLKEIRYEWFDIEGTRNGRELEITGVCEKSNCYVWEPDAEKYALSEEDWQEFKKKWR